jgi:ribosome-binding ATPase YchF (GTP1/OBG family)
MNNKELNIALGKLFNGIELDTHKVELSVIDDVKKIQNEIVEADVKLLAKNILRELRVAETKIEKSVKAGSKLKSKLKEAENMVKDLGVKTSGLAWYEDAQSSLRYLEDLKDYLSTIKSVIGKL